MTLEIEIPGGGGGGENEGGGGGGGGLFLRGGSGMPSDTSGWGCSCKKTKESLNALLFSIKSWLCF